ncbi:hypothetical protein ACIOYV_10845 [Pseudomonas sp. NPDC087342]
MVLTLASVLGLDGRSTHPSGLYLPELLGDAESFVSQLNGSGAVVSEEII